MNKCYDTLPERYLSAIVKPSHEFARRYCRSLAYAVNENFLIESIGESLAKLPPTAQYSTQKIAKAINLSVTSQQITMMGIGIIFALNDPPRAQIYVNWEANKYEDN